MKSGKLIIIVGIIISFGLALYLLIYTTPGSKFLAGKVLSEYADHDGLGYQDLEGTLGSGMTYKNFEIKDIKNFPAGTTLKIQSLFFNITSLGLNGIHVEIENARLKLPDSDLVIISGTFKEQQLNFNIYSKGVTVTEVLSYLPDFKKLVPIKGDVNDIDLSVTGNYLEPKIKGNFIIEKFVYEGFLLTNVPLNMDIQLKGMEEDVKLFGVVYLEKGELQTERVLVKVDKGQLNFSGPWDKPRINLKGSSRVEKTNISISLKGTMEKPELILNSEPPYSSQKIMIMLATGKSWQSVEDLIDSGLNSAALTKDFIDYFFFAGKSSQFARKFGISDFSVKFDSNHKGIAAKKEITSKIGIGYGVEQSNGKDLSKDITQNLEGEYKVNKELILGVGREIKQTQSNEILDGQTTENNNKVFLKYKKSF